MAKRVGSVSDEEAVESAASLAAERTVARTIGRPVGVLAGVLGFGLGLAALGSGDHAAAVGWLTLGSFGFAMLAVGSDAAGPAA